MRLLVLLATLAVSAFGAEEIADQATDLDLHDVSSDEPSHGHSDDLSIEAEQVDGHSLEHSLEHSDDHYGGHSDESSLHDYESEHSEDDTAWGSDLDYHNDAHDSWSEPSDVLDVEEYPAQLHSDFTGTAENDLDEAFDGLGEDGPQTEHFDAEKFEEEFNAAWGTHSDDL